MFLSVVTYLRLYFTSTHFQNKAKLCSLNSWWPLNRGENSIGELSLGRPKGGRGRLIEVRIYNIILQLFRDFDYWLLNRGWPLNGGSTVKMKINNL